MNRNKIYDADGKMVGFATLHPSKQILLHTTMTFHKLIRQLHKTGRYIKSTLPKRNTK